MKVSKAGSQAVLGPKTSRNRQASAQCVAGGSLIAANSAGREMAKHLASADDSGEQNESGIRR
jgi:hypothetical protein